MIGYRISAVTTTGIYCRPGCPAQPLATHVEGYPSAAAAEAAGFRACLRCRPYRFPPPPSWYGEGLICQAVRLVLDGGLDHATEAELGARLGLSGRHLRRLFQAKVGVTPTELARSTRTHFARRLLDDTDLSVTEIAFAAGYGSVRQLNRDCQEIFRASPGELRAKRRRGDRLVADGGLPVRLPVLGRLDPGGLLVALGADLLPDVEALVGAPPGGAYRRTIEVEGDVGVLELVVSAEPGSELVARFHLPHWSGLLHLSERARRLAGLAMDHERASVALQGDGLLGDSARARPGLRSPGAWDPLQAALGTLFEEQLGPRRGVVALRKLTAAAGSAVAGLRPFGLSLVFPTATPIATGPSDSWGLPGDLSRRAARLAGAIAAGDLPTDGSTTLDDLLVAARGAGLGAGGASRFAYRLGEQDAFPEADERVLRGLSVLTGAPVSREDAGALAERWRPWRGLAATHLAVLGLAGRAGRDRDDASLADRLPDRDVLRCS